MNKQREELTIMLNTWIVESLGERLMIQQVDDVEIEQSTQAVSAITIRCRRYE